MEAANKGSNISKLRKRRSEAIKQDLAIAKVGDISKIDPWNLPPYEIYEPESYKDGPEGFIQWCNDYVCIPIYPEGSDIAVWVPMCDLSDMPNPKTGKSYMSIWKEQQWEIRRCLRMIDGRFLYRLIVFCWMRGEGKSFIACLVQLWKFMNWPRQMIVLGANSKEQTKFVHFDIIRDIILNSPKILGQVGRRNIQEKEIRLRDQSDNIGSIIRPISSFSGIVSNITGYTFSEIFDMKNPKFFTQLDGSIRNIPNALGVIDSTVSSKDHILYNLFSSFAEQKTTTLYFSYRSSKRGMAEDFWNPNMDQSQLDDYKVKFLPADFDRYFRNVWGAAGEHAFSAEMMEATEILGIQGKLCPHQVIKEILEETKKKKDVIEGSLGNFKGDRAYVQEDALQEIEALKNQFWRIEDVMPLRDRKSRTPHMASIDDLNKIGDIYNTDWAILAGIDRADPMKSKRSLARTIITCVAKGLPGSRHNSFMFDPNIVPNYIYVLLHLCNVESSGLEEIKEVLSTLNQEYMGIDSLCGERWGIWDLANWCSDNDISFEALFPSYSKQQAAFSELFTLVSKGQFKKAPLSVWGTNDEDILVEEAKMFYHDADKHWFGSPEKNDAKGVQDDAMFSTGWCIYGGRMIRPEEFRERKPKMWFGSFVPDRTLMQVG